ncbi:MAG: glutamine--fructose-6-phosphate transaminase (isomerizing) [Elusimicrobia bacterium]|nr:glutamine--fructose-6-phosphate transaminase (isomerizing) [Candidatus Obscuribacterium magneticum]
MCGILGYIGSHQASPILLEGLRKLEYRGYDSAGMAVLSGGSIHLRRSVGKLHNLEALLDRKPLNGHLGLGHTRWATHGIPSEFNAHPHMDATGKIVVVHNGIIENYLFLKKKLISKGTKFSSDTDTEVVAHLISSFWNPLVKKSPKKNKENFVRAVQLALNEIEGTYALGVICSAVPDFMIGARKDCPLIVGLGEGENFLSSDAPAILSHTRDVVFLEEGDLAVVGRSKVECLDAKGRALKRAPTKILWDPIQAEKAGYKHFMHKEIHEQPRAVEDTLLGRLHMQSGDIVFSEIKMTGKEARALSQVRFIACGTSWHAGLVGSFLMEKYAGIPSVVDVASEFRYRDPVIKPNTLVISISQSGETADTLAAVRLARKKGAKTLTIANVMGSSLTRESDGALMTHCGPEIGVASTKTFVSQLVVIYLLALVLARMRNSLPPSQIKTYAQQLAHVSQWVSETLKCEKEVVELAKKYFRCGHFIFLGRNVNYPVALEGALKLKEVSYIFAEGYPGGEMKHGPIALIDESLPLVAIATKSSVYEKMLSNIEEAKSRGAVIIAVASKGDTVVKEKAAHVVYVPEVPEDLSPIINVLPLQLLAYHVAVLRGCDVDQPRNLAKSVTVE